MKRYNFTWVLFCFLAVGFLCLPGCGGGGGGGGGGQDLSSQADLPLDQSLPAALAKAKSRKLTSADNTPWVIMHSVIAFEKEMEVTSVAAGKAVNAIEFLCNESTYQGTRIFHNVSGQPVLPTRDLSFGLTQSYVVQDHVDQYLYAFAGAGVPLDQKITADDGTLYTVADMVRSSTRNFKPSQELGWTLVALPIYYGIAKPFTTDQNATYTVSDLMNLATQRVSSLEAEAGTHHLYGIAFALKAYQQSGGTLEGAWQSARGYLDWHITKARQSQKADGSFDMAAFNNWQEADSPSLRVWGTGHMLEWLYFALPPEQLREDWISRALLRVTNEILNRDTSAFSDGGFYHAAHALKLYQKTLFP